MKLNDYLLKNGISQKAFAATLGLTQGAISQWINSGVPKERFSEIEAATAGEVTRRDLYPDWATHWPELADKAA